MPKKYRKGATIDCPTWLIDEVWGNRWVYYKGRPLHPSFILHMTFSTVLGGLRGGKFAVAIERDSNANL